MGPCMCGDTHCPSCGPAQWNTRCPLCRAWADDGCEHVGDDGQLLPQHQAAADEKARQAEHEAQTEAEMRDWPYGY